LKLLYQNNQESNSTDGDQESGASPGLQIYLWPARLTLTFDLTPKLTVSCSCPVGPGPFVLIGITIGSFVLKLYRVLQIW